MELRSHKFNTLFAILILSISFDPLIMIHLKSVVLMETLTLQRSHHKYLKQCCFIH